MLGSVPVAVVAIALVVAVARLIVWSASTQVSFDGAMNLEVARSLAEGHGYRRLYEGHSGFSHEIQSRAPFILPAAAVFGAFGVGIWQAQLTNLLYVLALAAVVFVLVARWVSWRWAVAALAACLWTPGIREVAMNGYGEVPALCWWLAAILVLCPREDASPSAPRLFLAGALVGTAVLTKTVLAIGLIAIVPIVAVSLLSRRVHRESTVVGLLALVAGIVVPVAMYVAAHVFSLGDIQRWHAWLHDEIRAIHMQAGTAEGFKDTHGVGAKLLVHSQLLADNLGLPLPLLPVWLGAPIVLAVLGRRWLTSKQARAGVLALALFAAIYFFWWLGFTPTEKAWYRRIFDGVLVLEIVVVVIVAGAWNSWRRAQTMHPATPGMRPALVACVLLAALQVPLFWSNLDADDASDFGSRASLEWNLAALSQIPPNAEVYGIGWYSAPILALYSGRRFGNLATKTSAELAAASPVYLALDLQTQKTGAAQYWLDRFSHRELAKSAQLDLVELDARRVGNPFENARIDPAAVQGRVNFHSGEYPYLFGFQNREGDGWRWATTDAEVLLRYGGEREFYIDIYLPKLKGYRHSKKDVGVTVSIGSCRLGTFRQDQSRRERWWLPVAQCAIRAGEVVTVRMVSDNILESRDDRQLGYVVHGLGFSEPLGSESPEAP
ncbi:MAG TPA: hypothetical protein VH375_11420 [Rhodanobacteraceae bacterium]